MEEKKEQKKLSYEELRKIAGELDQQNRQLVQRIQQMQKIIEDRNFDYTSFFLSMLFKVTEHPQLYSVEFVDWVVVQIQDALTSFAKAGEKQEEKTDGNEAE